jgi:hypothetical protein
MRRKRNWILKRMVLGLAVTALVVPSAALAKVDEGGVGNAVQGVGLHGAPGAVFKAADKGAGAISIETVRLNPRSTTSDVVGMPRAMPLDYALQRGDAIEVARTNDRNVISADIENVRLQPRTTSTPELASAGFDWSDAGVGAAIVFGLVLLGGVALLVTRNQGKPQTA